MDHFSTVSDFFLCKGGHVLFKWVSSLPSQLSLGYAQNKLFCTTCFIVVLNGHTRDKARQKACDLMA